jgi:hypothetical protein
MDKQDLGLCSINGVGKGQRTSLKGQRMNRQVEERPSSAMTLFWS